MNKIHNLAGRKYGRLTAIKLDGIRRGRTYWECKCECGTTKSFMASNLSRGNTRSCGCLSIDVVIKQNKSRATHRRTGTPEYRAWGSMKERCYRRTHASFQYYGAMGVTVCDRWLNSFESFLADMGERPPGIVRVRSIHSLDRYPNKDGNYEPGNVRWATGTQQMNNRRPFKKRQPRAQWKKWREIEGQTSNQDGEI